MQISLPIWATHEYNSPVGLLSNAQAERNELLNDGVVLQALQLAERIQEGKGEPLDDDDLLAVAEATGVSVEYVKLVREAKTSQDNRNFLDALRRQYLNLNPDMRRFVASGLLAGVSGLMLQLGRRLDVLTLGSKINSHYGIFETIACVLAIGALYNAATARQPRIAGIAGCIYAAGTFFMAQVFSLVLLLPNQRFESFDIFLYAVAGAAIGVGSHTFFNKSGKKFGLVSQEENRRELLNQLVELQDKLKQGEQFVSFLSLDIVGSTKMKAGADMLAVEFTFTEYQKFVETVVNKYGGRIHSTAGDGTTCAFDSPQNAFLAARNIQTGLVELNLLRNKLSQPIVVRAGIHAGHVLAPNAGDITSVNFANVIDVAAHLQKEASPGGILISGSAKDLIGVPGLTLNRFEGEIDGEAAYEWRPKQALPTKPVTLPNGMPTELKPATESSS